MRKIEIQETENGLVIPQTGMLTTYKCNLKCKLCCTGSPYMRDDGRFKYDDIVKSIDEYFKIFAFVDKFSLGGGEPQLRNDLPDIIEHAMQYKKQFSQLEVLTNGTLIFEDKLLNVLEKYNDKMFVMIDNYGESISKNAYKLADVLKSKNIIYEVRKYYGADAHCGGWIDLGDLSQKHFTEEETVTQFKKCAFGKRIGYVIVDGALSFCARYARTVFCGVVDRIPGEYVDLLDDSISVEEKRKQFLELSKITHLSACAFCNGHCEDSKRFEPAEQLK